MRFLLRCIQLSLFTLERNKACVIILHFRFLTWLLLSRWVFNPDAFFLTNIVYKKPNKRPHYQWLIFIKCTWSPVGIFGRWLGREADTAVSPPQNMWAGWLKAARVWNLAAMATAGRWRMRGFCKHVWSCDRGDVTSAALLTFWGMMGRGSCLHCDDVCVNKKLPRLLSNHFNKSVNSSREYRGTKKLTLISGFFRDIHKCHICLYNRFQNGRYPQEAFNFHDSFWAQETTW